MFEIWNIPWSEGDMELFLGRCHEEKYRGYLKIRFHVTIFPSRSRFSRVWTTRFDAVKRWTNRGQIRTKDEWRLYQRLSNENFEKFWKFENRLREDFGPWIPDWSLCLFLLAIMVKKLTKIKNIDFKRLFKRLHLNRKINKFWIDTYSLIHETFDPFWLSNSTELYLNFEWF